MRVFKTWETPEFTGVGRLPGRATLLPYDTTEAAHLDEAPRVLDLNGDWAFTVYERPEDMPAEAVGPLTYDAGWDHVAVPGNFTMQGFGNPQYTNVKMPFTPNNPPHVPEQNPTGLYRTRFTLPDDWQDRRVVLHVGAATSVSSVWVNGTQVGIGKDSRLPSEYDITSAIESGDNLLAIQVIQWSDASYIEDQDQWWQAGINRSVYLYATGPVYLHDVAAKASYDHTTGQGQLDVQADIKGDETFGWTTTATLYDSDGQTVLTAPLEGWLQRLTTTLESVHPWSAEVPTLYTLVVSLRDPDGNEVEATRTRIGFRTVEIRDRQLLVNGKAVYFHGVNRHEHHETRGSAVPRDLMRKDVEVLKAFNVNAVRTSHYPPDPYFLDLCDEYGLYVIDEANIESHANYTTLCEDPRYQAAFVDRVSRMVLRDRNHPSIIAWSLGNESGYGANNDAAAGWVRRVDPSRVLHYEGAIGGHQWEGGHHATDLVCPMYPSIDSIVEWAKTTTDWRPLIMCEYAHAMGNSCGNLADYWEAIESHHGLQGGFIWEMLDHGIRKTTEDGREYWGYGGDFGEEIHDGNFVCDGLFWPDRTPHTAMWEAKRLFQPFDAVLEGDTLRVTNKYDFRDLSHLRVLAEVSVDGRVVETTVLPQLSTPAGESSLLPVPWSRPKLAPGEEAYVTLRFVDPSDQPLLGAGHEVGWVQLAIGTGPQPVVSVHEVQDTLQASETGDTWTIGNSRVEVSVNQNDGALTAWKVDGVDLLAAGPVPTVWRAPTDNDGIRMSDETWHTANQAYFRWKAAGLDRLVAEPQTDSVRTESPNLVVVSRMVRYVAEGRKLGFTHTERLSIYGDGVIAADHAFEIDEGLTDLARVGVVARIPAGFEQLEWFGRGPHESYVDRKAGAAVGRWKSTVTEQYVPYILPQEHGNHTDVRWLALRREDGAGLLVSADDVVEAKASHFSDKTLGTAWHTVDLTPEDETYLAIDVRQRGLGGASCGPDTLERYRVPSGTTYRLRYRLVPLRPGDDPALLHRS